MKSENPDWEAFLNQVDLLDANNVVLSPKAEGVLEDIRALQEGSFRPALLKKLINSLRAFGRKASKRIGRKIFGCFESWLDSHNEAVANPDDPTLKAWRRDPLELATIEGRLREANARGCE